MGRKTKLLCAAYEVLWETMPWDPECDCGTCLKTRDLLSQIERVLTK